MAVGKIGKTVKRLRFGFQARILIAVLIGLSFFVIWSTFSSPSSSVVSRRDSFGDIESEEEKSGGHHHQTKSSSNSRSSRGHKPLSPAKKERKKPMKSLKGDRNGEKLTANDETQNIDGRWGGMNKMAAKNVADKPEGTEEKEKRGEKEDIEEVTDGDGVDDADLDGGVNADAVEAAEVDTAGKSESNRKKPKKSGPLFDLEAHYAWKLCDGKSGYHYIPCIDLEGGGSGKLQNHRHHERSCPREPPMCLTPLPQGYDTPIPWPESQLKIFYKNVAHPKLHAFIKTQNWLKLSGDYLTFPRNESIFSDGAAHYLDFIGEMVPDIDWGRNIRIVLDIGCTDSSYASALFEKDVLTISIGMMNDQTDLAQLFLERGLPAVINIIGVRRLPFPSGVFDAIHCGECSMHWHTNGGRTLLEMNRILRPGGFFIISFRHRDIEGEEAMTKLTSSICWNILGYKTDDETDLGVKIYQRPSSNDVYELRIKKEPPLCKENESQDAAWYTPIKACLHSIPASIEQRGTDWPEEWPKRLETFPEWLADSQEKLGGDTERWKSIVNKSYLNGMGIDWSRVRNVLDMKAIYGGFAAALASQKVWVMNIVPVHAPNTLPVIYERGLLGMYHDWCESFSTYPRSYDLLHADHLFSRLKNRCRQPVSIVVEMDRILRPGGWAIIREKLENLNPLEEILKTLHWEIVMTYSQGNQGIICAQKTTWRP